MADEVKAYKIYWQWLNITLYPANYTAWLKLFNTSNYFHY